MKIIVINDKFQLIGTDVEIINESIFAALLHFKIRTAINFFQKVEYFFLA
jgi:hypothetical protein